MPAITQDLINRCYAVLKRCDQFQSMASLRAVFVTQELQPFREGLRDAESIEGRVQLNVEYLLYQKIDDGQYVFVVFLDTLRSSCTGKALHDDLRDLQNEFGQSLGQTNRIPVPFVVAAMNRSEADSLQSGMVFDDPRIAPIERDRFNTLTPFLPEGWQQDYGEQRDDWKLHADHRTVIGTVLRDMFADINYDLRQSRGLPVIDGISYSERFFSSEQQGEAWDDLQISGGLLIVDAISLFYPPIRQALVLSTVAFSDQIAVLVLSPLDHHAAPVNGHITELVRQEMPMTFARFAKHLDHRLEMGIGDLCGVQRWLFTLFSRPEDMAEILQKRTVDLNRRRMRGQAVTGKMPGVIFRQNEVER